MLLGLVWLRFAIAFTRTHIELQECFAFLMPCTIVRVHPLHIQTSKLNKQTNIVRERYDTLSPFDAIHQYCTSYLNLPAFQLSHARDKQRTFHGFIMYDVYDCYGVKHFRESCSFRLAIAIYTTMSCTNSVPLIIREYEKRNEQNAYHIYAHIHSAD